MNRNRNAMRLAVCLVLVTGIVPALASSAGQRRGAPGRSDVAGRWLAELVIPSGPVTFELDLSQRGSAVSGKLLNGPEPMAFSRASFDGTTLILELEQYDGRITASFEDAGRTKLIGQYQRQTRNGIGTYRFSAVREPSGRTKPGRTGKVDSAVDISGEWILTLKGPGDAAPEVNEATFSVRGTGDPHAAAVTGTLIPVSGDYGLLSGRISRDPASGDVRISMSRFDGIHVVRIDGRLEADGTLAGTLASGLSYEASWTAVRKDRVAATTPEPEDPFALTSVKAPGDPFAFSLPDTDGHTVALTDERFRGKVVLIDIFGTWCPNCHDSAPLLVELYRKYHDRGLEVVMLSYEYTPDQARNRRQIDIFRRKYGIPYPILMAGTTADGEIARTLPQLVGFGAYPTSIFLGRDGRVRRIHAGFSGPATGERHGRVKREFEDLVRELLDEKP